MTEDEYRHQIIEACNAFGRELQALVAVLNDLIQALDPENPYLRKGGTVPKPQDLKSTVLLPGTRRHVWEQLGDAISDVITEAAKDTKPVDELPVITQSDFERRCQEFDEGDT